MRWFLYSNADIFLKKNQQRVLTRFLAKDKRLKPRVFLTHNFENFQQFFLLLFSVFSVILAQIVFHFYDMTLVLLGIFFTYMGCKKNIVLSVFHFLGIDFAPTKYDVKDFSYRWPHSISGTCPEATGEDKWIERMKNHCAYLLSTQHGNLLSLYDIKRTEKTIEKMVFLEDTARRMKQFNLSPVGYFKKMFFAIDMDLSHNQEYVRTEPEGQLHLLRGAVGGDDILETAEKIRTKRWLAENVHDNVLLKTKTTNRKM